MVKPSRSYHTDGLKRLNNPLGEAKGTPLFERIARGKPRSSKRRSNAVNAGFLHSTPFPRTAAATAKHDRWQSMGSSLDICVLRSAHREYRFRALGDGQSCARAGRRFHCKPAEAEA